MKCVSCVKGRPWECEHKGNCSGVYSNPSVDNPGDSDLGSSDGVLPKDDPIQDIEGSEEDEGRNVNTYKDDSVLKDQQSTGRKRAAVMYPLNEEAPCEWRMKKNCGGGDYPIIGCFAGTQQARHHGPDKNTLNNDAGNVHRICHTCHNRWHHRNNDGYVWGSVYPLHQPVEATKEEVLLNDVSWAGHTLKKVVD